MFPGLKAGLIIPIEGFAEIRSGLVSKGRVERISSRTTANAPRSRNYSPGALAESYRVRLNNLKKSQFAI